MSSSAGMKESRVECMALLVALHFFNLTNFFWMMVEGNFGVKGETISVIQ